MKALLMYAALAAAAAPSVSHAASERVRLETDELLGLGWSTDLEQVLGTCVEGKETTTPMREFKYEVESAEYSPGHLEIRIAATLLRSRIDLVSPKLTEEANFHSNFASYCGEKYVAGYLIGGSLAFSMYVETKGLKAPWLASLRESFDDSRSKEFEALVDRIWNAARNGMKGSAAVYSPSLPKEYDVAAGPESFGTRLGAALRQYIADYDAQKSEFTQFHLLEDYAAFGPSIDFSPKRSKLIPGPWNIRGGGEKK